MTSIQSPYGGTTSLPQFLQQRTTERKEPYETAAPPKTKPTVSAPAAGSPRGTGGDFGQPAQPPAPTPTPYPISQTGNPVIPPAPPPAVPANVAPATPLAPPATPPGQTGQATPNAPIGLENLRGYIEKLLGNSSRYSDDQVQAMRTTSQQGLEDTRRLEEDRLRADAASRGVFYGSGLSTSLGDASQRYVRGLAEAETGLQTRIADANAQDKQSAIGNAFSFGQGEMQNQSLVANILALLAQQGGAGGPTIPGATGDIASVPGPAPADYSSIYQLLGTLFAPKQAA